MSIESGCVSAICVHSGVDLTVNSSVTPGVAFSKAALIGSIRSTPRPTIRSVPWYAGTSAAAVDAAAVSAAAERRS